MKRTPEEIINGLKEVFAKLDDVETARRKYLDLTSRIGPRRIYSFTKVATPGIVFSELWVFEGHGYLIEVDENRRFKVYELNESKTPDKELAKKLVRYILKAEL